MGDLLPVQQVIHVGNSPSGSGGIATVIRNHLGRDIGIELTALASYDQDRPGACQRNRPAWSTLVRILGTRPAPGLAWHFHLSQGGSLVREGLLLWGATLRGHRRTVVTLHGSSVSGMNRLGRRLLRGVVRPATVIHALSSIHAAALFHDSRIVVIPNDVRIPPHVVPLSERARRVVFAGEVSQRKGADVLMTAWRQAGLSGWELVIAGPERDIDIAAIRGVDGASYLGELPHEELLNLLAFSAICVLPSRAEALPMSVCEAMAAGCAVIATDVGGTRDLLGAESPFLIPSGDAPALADRLRALAHNEELIAEVGSHNRQRAVDVLSSDVVDRRWRELYRALRGRCAPTGRIA